MSAISKIVYLFLSSIFFTFVDFYATDFILNNGFKLLKNPFFSIIFVQNYGAAFNIFDGSKVFLILFSIFALVCIYIYAIKHIQKFSVIALFFLSMLIAGIFSNMLERCLFGFVRDYIKLNFVNFPIFNISDILINIGVFAFIIIILKNNYIKKN